MNGKPTPFQVYLAKIGDEAAAKLFRVQRRTVQSWRLGERYPRPRVARSIVAKAPSVSLDDIYAN
jgi:hypothetical protein